jgi:hypothetical protein
MAGCSLWKVGSERNLVEDLVRGRVGGYWWTRLS